MIQVNKASRPCRATGAGSFFQSLEPNTVLSMPAVSPQILAEEDALLERFGNEYGRYVAHVPRWLA